MTAVRQLSASTMISHVSAATIELLKDHNTTGCKFPGKLSKLLASAGLRELPKMKLAIGDVDAALATRNLSIEKRMELKAALHQMGLL